MKISEHWLREWVNPKLDVRRLAEQLTLAGLEVESINPCLATFSHVVVGEVLEIIPHPNADKLKVCTVNSGKKRFQIVCGAPNVRIGMRAPLALPGAVLPNGIEVKAVKLRGVDSIGMLCSAKELDLSEDASGLMALPVDAPVGKSMAEYLDLPDTVLDIKLTPNRGDCLSVAGLAREVAAINRMRLNVPRIATVRPRCNARLPVVLKAAAGCPLYAGRIIQGLRTNITSPLWLTERLRRAGLRPIHPVVDVTNYVMLEYGQPLHAFDLRYLQGGIVVRWARQGESLTLLDGRRITLSKDVLVIADHKKAKALAGIMGGEDSGVADDTADIFIESAFFVPQAIAGKARRYGLSSEAAHRFERGVDSALPRRALERATALLLAIAGGLPGPLVETRAVAGIPKPRPVKLRRERLSGLLGIAIPDREIASILRRLEMKLKIVVGGWQVTPPSYRFDISREEDLIEEVGRMHGFDRIPAATLIAGVQPGQADEHRLSTSRLREALVQRGYSEVITYSFVPPALDSCLAGDGIAVELKNPISAEMSQLRRSLWPGLIQTLRYNLNRQQERARIFEYGRRYSLQGNDIKEEDCIAGLTYGRVEPEQWGIPERSATYEDMKSDVEALFAMVNTQAQFVRARHPALHPGRSAAICLGKHHLGWLGELHPELVRQLDLPAPAIVFELNRQALSKAHMPAFVPISRYPALRRDIAVVVPESVTASALQACVTEETPNLLQEVLIFDIYRGPGIDSGRKSVALSLILQDSSRTLTDEAADTIMSQIVERLRRKLGATIRD
ncbi:MAG TPA: phenylalanine--tRNA ligase subunit beta [Gammaproteobacteria bacterium]|nr:phenylalanine--tRNA ligase subunit beta [Gammaproteobacteria bacterium]